MQRCTQRIITIDAKSLFKYFPKRKNAATEPFCLDTRKISLYTLVVKQNELEECPMLDQILEVLKEDFADKIKQEDNNLLYDQFLIMDFDDIFMPIKEDASESLRRWKEGLQNNVRDLMENGFKIQFKNNHEVLMVPFDKSGNMSRNGRISFVNKKYVERLNERLNLGMDFSKIQVILSKYYAYRGLYLSTSQRVNFGSFKLTPETVVIIRDKRNEKDNGAEKDVMVETAKPKNAKEGELAKEWEFTEPEINPYKKVEKPYDGEGFISPTYSKYINKALGIEGANSFQIRLPFAKGMLHQVDVLAFIKEFSVEGTGDEQYLYEDAFGIERDLRKAHILMTESMFKGKVWLKKFCDEKKIKDPMEYYCEAIAKYNHGFYVSGTNLPYGHSSYTHLSYQTINTLAFDDDQFKRIIEGHCKFIKEPIEFIKKWDELENDNVVKEDSEENYYLPNWKRALLKNPAVAGDKYIHEQLENTQKSLLSKIAMGKILVEGQTRYLCRDLAPLLFSLLKEDKDFDDAYIRNLFSRFYLPQGKNDKIKLNFEDYYAFFRNPHLSRNEQYMLRAFVHPKSEKDYAKDGKKSYEKYTKYVNMFDKYFGHLTGIVMVAKGSTLPLCLGGADFDGDLVSVVTNKDVVNAVAKGVYKLEESPSLDYYERKLSVIEIPSNDASKVTVPELVPYQHIYDTFSNYIGRISNIAISIGQKEYDRTSTAVAEFNANAPTCAKCTILTGLEIDAAKNGVHPNLDLILKKNISRSGYLDFLSKFKKLKAEKYFYYKNLTISNKTRKIGKEKIKLIEIGAKNCKTKVIWKRHLETTGTYINLLPKYFVDYYNKFSKDNFIPIKFEVKQKSTLNKGDKEKINKFKNKCEEIIQIYSYYKNKFLKKLKEEKEKGYYAVDNIETIIMHIYDENSVDNRLYEILPSVKEKITAAIDGKTTAQEIRERINAEQWLIQPVNRRGEILEKIIGNGFKVTDLTDDERELLFHFNQQGYKILWRIMDWIEGPKMPAYEELCVEMEKERKEFFDKAKISSDTVGAFESLLKKELRVYYDGNTVDIGNILYDYCKNELRRLINENVSSKVDDSKLDIKKLVIAFYEKTRSKASKVRFFWDVFTWEEIQFMLEDEGGNERC